MHFDPNRPDINSILDLEETDKKTGIVPLGDLLKAIEMLEDTRK